MTVIFIIQLLTVKSMFFNTENERNEYLDKNIDDLKNMGDNMHIEKHRKHICLGYCKKLSGNL